jgi:hypothetical protein
MTAIPQTRFENEIGPHGALSAHKIPRVVGASDFVRESCPPGARLVLKARVVGGTR